MMSMLHLMHAVVKLNQDKSHSPVEIINNARKHDQELEKIKEHRENLQLINGQLATALLSVLR